MPCFKKILVPTDFSTHSERALAVAIDLAKRDGASLRLLHVEQPVIAPAPVRYMPPLLGLDGVAAAVRARCLDQLRESGQHARAGGVSEVTTELCEGFAWREIVNHAERDTYDLIVMGTHGRTGIQHALLGSVAERVVRKAPCSVLTVRTDQSTARSAAGHEAAGS